MFANQVMIYTIFLGLLMVACWQAYSISVLQLTGYQLRTRYYLLWLKRYNQQFIRRTSSQLISLLSFYKDIYKRRKEQEEIIMLYELLQADLYSLADGDQVNIQHVLQDNLSFFPECGERLMGYLHMWKFSPAQAKKQLIHSSKGEVFHIIAELLIQVNDLPKENALPILKNAQEVLSKEFQELRKRRKEKTFISVDLLFFLANMWIMLWLLLFIVSMFQHLLQATGYSP